MVLHQSSDKLPTFLVWDEEGPAPEGDWVAVLWRGYGEDHSMTGYSIPRRVEEQADALRARFLAWLYGLGEAQIYGRRLVDLLVLRPGFSYWWMTLLVEKSHDRSAHLLDAVRMLALESLVGVHSARKIVLASGDKTLARAFKLWCGNAGLAFELCHLKGEANAAALARRLFSFLPHPVQALASLLAYLWRRWPLRNSGKFQKLVSDDNLTIVDYLFQLSPNALATGQFGSNYWTDLVPALDDGTAQVNWLHNYVGHEALPTARHACDAISRFNQNSPETQRHVALDGALSWSVILGTVRDYARIALVSLLLRKARKGYRPVDSKIDLWPLFEQDWRQSMLGITAIANCLFLNLFERTLKNLPHQALGVYLQENQGWEMAFIYAWRAAGHGRLIGVPHSVVRYWDLRYFSDPRSYLGAGANNLPMPDVVALNGSAAMSVLRKGGYPEDRMQEVEALRYLYLADPPEARMRAQEAPINRLRVLTLCDYLPVVTQRQLQWLAQAAHQLPMDTRYIVKPHLACPVLASDYPSLKLEIAKLPLAELLSDCDVAYTSNITAAAVDAYCAGVPVVSVLDGRAFNMSPLRGLEGVVYATGPNELARALRHGPGSRAAKAEAYFCLDRRLRRWRRLLGLPAHATP